MKIKTSELEGIALDWAVAKCENQLPAVKYAPVLGKYLFCLGFGEVYHPSSSWSQAGPIIEREGIDIEHRGYSPKCRAVLDWLDETYSEQFSDSTLQAAMRCYVASKMGDEVDIPDAILGIANA